MLHPFWTGPRSCGSPHILKCLYAYCSHLPSIKDTCKKLQLYTYTFAYVGLFSFKQILQYVHLDWSSGG